VCATTAGSPTQGDGLRGGRARFVRAASPSAGSGLTPSLPSPVLHVCVIDAQDRCRDEALRSRHPRSLLPSIPPYPLLVPPSYPPFPHTSSLGDTSLTRLHDGRSPSSTLSWQPERPRMVSAPPWCSRMPHVLSLQQAAVRRCDLEPSSRNIVPVMIWRRGAQEQELHLTILYQARSQR
jgi:hypothetical protein